MTKPNDGGSGKVVFVNKHTEVSKAASAICLVMKKYDDCEVKAAGDEAIARAVGAIAAATEWMKKDFPTQDLVSAIYFSATELGYRGATFGLELID